jgi:soluble lytic murein transglycosylase-like protein
VPGDIPGGSGSDFDADFARAADRLEAGQRAGAEEILAAIGKKSGERAWEARAALLLAADDLRRKDYAAAMRRLRAAPAEAIGLEPYRLALLGRALEAAGLHTEAVQQFRAAFETPQPFASRFAAGRALASALENSRDPRGAAAVLARLAADAPRSEAAGLAAERLRLGLASGDRASIRAASRDYLFSGAAPDALPPPSRRAIQQEESRLSPAERGRLGVMLVARESYERGARLLRADALTRWPAPERAANELALARVEAHLGRAAAAQRAALAVPRDGTPADFEARLLVVDQRLDRERSRNAKLSAADPAAAPLIASLSALSQPPVPDGVRVGALARLIRLDADAERLDDGLALARAIVAASPGSTLGFEPLWRLTWDHYLAGDFAGARSQMEALGEIYSDAARSRRLSYWRGRCLEKEGKRSEAETLYAGLAVADPSDLYALFARKRLPAVEPFRPPRVSVPSTATAEFRRADELLRLRLFEEAAAEARSLPVSRGRDLRLAQAEFALGQFSGAAVAARRAFPELGTPQEAQVPDGWRRLYYPIEEKRFLEERAREFGLDPAILRGLVRQESVFDPKARSRAGALGLTQLMPATARSLSRSVLRSRYREAFLYDPGANARLGAAYFKNLLDRFEGKTIFALAAYNGGPTRMARVLRENSFRNDDEIFESHPAYETRDYVRHVMLYAESYRELYK